MNPMPPRCESVASAFCDPACASLQDVKNVRRKVDQAAWKRHIDDANSVMIWAKENLSPDGRCVFYQPQDVARNKARLSE